MLPRLRTMAVAVGGLVLLAAIAAPQPPPVLGTIAGSPYGGFVDGLGRGARFQSPAGMTSEGDVLYVADSGNHAIRAVDLTTGEVTTVAGTGSAGFDDGLVATATFDTPRDVLYEPGMNALLVADAGNNVIRAIDLSAGEVTTYAGAGAPGWADGDADQAQFNEPSGLCLAYFAIGAAQETDGARQSGPTVVVADTGNHCIREIYDIGGNSPGGEAGKAITPGTRYVGTLCGMPTSPGFTDDLPYYAQFNRPVGVMQAAQGNAVLIADSGNHAIRLYDAYAWLVGTVQGDGTPGDGDSPGTGTTARFNTPLGIGPGTDGRAWIGDSGNHRVRMLDSYAGSVETLVGSVLGYLDAPLPTALLNEPWDVASTGGGVNQRGAPAAFISDSCNNCIRAVGENTPPAARTGGPYVVGPGDSLLLDGSKSFDPDVLLGDHVADWAWDLDFDGTFDEWGETVSLTPFEVWWYFGDSRPGVTYPYNRRIVLQVMDIFGATDTASTLVTVTGDLAPNLAPTLLPEPPWTRGTENLLEWTGVEGASLYELQWSRSPRFGVIVGSLTTPQLKGLATGLSHNVTYYYRACALFGGEYADDAPALIGPGYAGPWSNVEFSTQDARAPESSFGAPADPLRSNTARTRLPWGSMESGSGFANMSVWYSYEGGPLTQYPGRWRPDSVTPLPAPNEELAQGTLLFDVAAAEGDGSYELWLSGRDNVGNDEDTRGYRDLRLIVDSTPPEITDIRVFSITQDSADISWRTSERATCVLAYGETIAYAHQLPTGPAKAHQVHLSGLQTDTQYHFEITATDDFGNTADSGDQTFRTLRPDPLVISNIEVTNITRDSADILWETNRPTASFVEYGKTRAYGSEALAPTIARRHRVHLSGLEWGTLYHFRITAVDGYGLEAHSPDGTFRTVQPSPPTIFDIEVTNIQRESADISWKTDKLTTGLVTYGEATASGATVRSPALARSHRVHLSGLTPDTLYQFRITATDRLGLSSESREQTFRTKPGRPTAPVLDPEPEFTKRTANTLSWSAADWAVKYRLEVAGDAAFANPMVYETRRRAMTVGELADGATYYYRVAGVNSAGVRGPYSNVEHSTQDASPPETHCELVSAPTAAAPPASIHLRLVAHDATSGVQYLLLYCAKDRGPFRQYNGRFDPSTTDVLFSLEKGGGHYAFYTIGVDSVGNREAAPATPDVEVDARVPTTLAYLGDLGTTTGQDALIAATLTDVFGSAIPGASIGYAMGSLSGTLPATDARGFAQATVNVPLPPGLYDLVLSYGGSTTLQGCSTTVGFVVKPVFVPPGPRVAVTGRGTVVDAAGEVYTFDIDAASNPLGGSVRLIVGGKLVQSTLITSVNAGGSSATITGMATVDGGGAYRFVVRVTDGAPDRFGMTVTDGTFVPPADLSSGSVAITVTP